MSQRSLASIEVRLMSIQSQLQRSVNQTRRKPISSTTQNQKCKFKRTTLKIPHRPCKVEGDTAASGSKAKFIVPEQTVIRLIKPAILLHEENGQLVSELRAVDDRRAQNLSLDDKLQLIRHVQGLRLLLWLFREDNYCQIVRPHLTSVTSSSLLWQTRLTASRHHHDCLSELLCRTTTVVITYLISEHASFVDLVSTFIEKVSAFDSRTSLLHDTFQQPLSISNTSPDSKTKHLSLVLALRERTYNPWGELIRTSLTRIGLDRTELELLNRFSNNPLLVLVKLKCEDRKGGTNKTRILVVARPILGP